MSAVDRVSVKRPSRRKWNEVEDVWLSWIYNSVRLRKYEVLFEGANGVQHEQLPQRFGWSLCLHRFNHYHSVTRCFETFAGAVSGGGAHRRIGEWLKGGRSEDSIKQHWRNPLWLRLDERARTFYGLEHALTDRTALSKEEWTALPERTKWLYRRGVVHRDLLRRFMGTVHYNGRCRGIRRMGNSRKAAAAGQSTTWLATYRDVKILRFDSQFDAATGWDQEVRANHGAVIDSNLLLSIRDHIALIDRIQTAWSGEKDHDGGEGM